MPPPAARLPRRGCPVRTGCPAAAAVGRTASRGAAAARRSARPRALPEPATRTALLAAVAGSPLATRRCRRAAAAGRPLARLRARAQPAQTGGLRAAASGQLRAADKAAPALPARGTRTRSPAAPGCLGNRWRRPATRRGAPVARWAPQVPGPLPALLPPPLRAPRTRAGHPSPQRAWG
jgi:hypothetical protein